MTRKSASSTHQGELRSIASTNSPGAITGIKVYFAALMKAVEGWDNLEELGIVQRR